MTSRALKTFQTAEMNPCTGEAPHPGLVACFLLRGQPACFCALVKCPVMEAALGPEDGKIMASHLTGECVSRAFSVLPPLSDPNNHSGPPAQGAQIRKAGQGQ